MEKLENHYLVEKSCDGLSSSQRHNLLEYTTDLEIDWNGDKFNSWSIKFIGKYEQIIDTNHFSIRNVAKMSYTLFQCNITNGIIYTILKLEKFS